MKPLVIVWIAHVLCYAVLLARLWYTRKIKTYPALSIYLALDILGNMVTAWLPTLGRVMFTVNVASYLPIWACVNMVLLIALTCAVGSMFARMFSHFLNFGWARSTLCWIFGIIGIVAALAPLPFEWLAIEWTAPATQLSLMVARYCHAALLVFTACTFMFFGAFNRRAVPAVRYRPNAIVTLQAIMAYLAVMLTGELLSVLDSRTIWAYNVAQLGAVSAVLLWWAWAITEDGEVWTAAPVAAYDPRQGRLNRFRKLLARLERRVATALRA